MADLVHIEGNKHATGKSKDSMGYDGGLSFIKDHFDQITFLRIGLGTNVTLIFLSCTHIERSRVDMPASCFLSSVAWMNLITSAEY